MEGTIIINMSDLNNQYRLLEFIEYQDVGI